MVAKSDITACVSRYGADVAARFATGGGEPEELLRTPFDNLLKDLAQLLDIPKVVAAGEHHLADERVRPDYAVHVEGLLVGFVELKQPGRGANPSRFKGHDRVQWERLSCLPNVLYADGQEFGLYRDGERVMPIVRLHGDVETAGAAVGIEDGDALLRLFGEFLGWKPVPPRRPRELARTSARLCRLLRAEVEELLSTDEGLRALAEDWRRLLFPEASDEEFADGYAQAVTFALLLARVEGVDIAGRNLRDVADELGRHHTLMGRALDVLTSSAVLDKLAVSVNALQRVLGVVDWLKVSKGDPAAWLYFYEDFLDDYDPALRRATGSYYTPVEAVDPIVRMIDDLLRSRLGYAKGFAAGAVTVVDPGAGTGTFLFRVIDRIAETVESDEGEGAIGPALRAAASRLVGFELQAGPYAVAELRLSNEYARRDAPLGARELRLYLTDTLGNPFTAEEHLPALYAPIAESRNRANAVKREEPVLVVLGNPPYRERSKGRGGWIEQGNPDAKQPPPLADFIPPKDWGVGAHVKHLYNPYVYFWRWATWKVFEHHPGDRGVVAYISVAGFLNGPGFAGMRAYLRRTADAVWVIDCSPEGHQPDVPTRIFQGVQQPICITLALRDGSTDPETPATVRFTSVGGRREEKFAQLAALELDGDGWSDCPAAWGAPFLPAHGAEWGAHPALNDLLAWSGSGTMPGRTWVTDPSPAHLRARWLKLIRVSDQAEKTALLDEHPTDRKITTVLSDNLPGYPTPTGPLATEKGGCPAPERFGWRSFDRQWIVPDKRVINRPNPGLWQVRRAPDQVFLTALHRTSPSGGPALTATEFVPDIDHYHGRGGRAWPLWLDAAGTTPNVVPGLLEHLAELYGVSVSGPDVFAYIAGITAHPDYTARFADDLAFPGLRVPLTHDGSLFFDIAEAGRTVLWLHTFGERFVDRAAGRPPGPPKAPNGRRPKVRARHPIPDDEAGMPESIEFEEAKRTLHVGSGQIAPVELAVWEYEVSGMRVVKRWFDRRKKEPEGRRSSELDEIRASTWDPDWTTELLEILNVLTLLRDLEPEQAELLDGVLARKLVTVDDLMAAGVLPVVTRPTVEQPPKPGDRLFDP